MRSARFLLLATSALAVAISTQEKQYQHPSSESDEGFGRVHMDISCAPRVAAEFDRAVALLHNFWYGRSCREVCQRPKLLDARSSISEQWLLSTEMPVRGANQPATRITATRWRLPTPNIRTTKLPCFMDCQFSVRFQKVPTVLSNRRKLQNSSRLCTHAIPTILAHFTT